MKRKFIRSSLLIVLLPLMSNAKIWTPSVISDNMVIQQNDTIKIWGWTTDAHEFIELKTSWSDSIYRTKAFQGKWMFQVVTSNDNQPQEISISGHEELVIRNILIGEVWLCAGQSNMEWSAKHGIIEGEVEVEKANYPLMRFFKVDQWQSDFPQQDLSGEWVECSPDEMFEFSSVAYFFGRELLFKLTTPVGLIQSTWGGSAIETWVPEDLITGEKFLRESAMKLKTDHQWVPALPGVIYNAMIHPLTLFKIKGAIWYQGEANTINADSYYRTFPLLIETWRKRWESDFPFYYVQIAPFDYDADPWFKEKCNAEVIRDAQLKTMGLVKNTGMVVTTDIGNIEDIHPRNKKDVGIRLSLWALNKTYRKNTSIAPSGPIYKDVTWKKRKAIINFDYAEDGLEISDDSKLRDFFIADEDGKYVSAKARISKNGKSVEVWADKIKRPKSIMFGFSNTSVPNLIGRNGLPASPFKTESLK